MNSGFREDPTVADQIKKIDALTRYDDLPPAYTPFGKALFGVVARTAVGMQGPVTFESPSKNI